MMVETLSLENVEIYPLDWRSFLRKTEYPIQLFCARASLAPTELLRMFKPSCVYKNAELLYWASAQWQPTDYEKVFMRQHIGYTIKNKKRTFVFFSMPNVKRED
jgi:hypothetical protein